MLYRIFTEDVNREQIIRYVSRVFDGFTIYQTTGYWKGAKEASLVIEIITKKADKRIAMIAKSIKNYNKQQAVLVQVVKASSKLV